MHAAARKETVTAEADIYIRAENIRKTYRTKHGEVEALKGASLTVRAGESVSLTGRSGCGKSTFLYIAGLLEPATSGGIALKGKECGHLSESARTKIRKEYLGFIYQFHGLLSDFTALENVLAPFMIAGKVTKEHEERAAALMERTGIYHRRSHMPKELSGGEQQRVAAARAMIKKPAILLADEPTGNLDDTSAGVITEAAFRYCEEEKAAFLCVTHNTGLAAQCASRYRLEDGVIHAA